jgi:hypothetical protein
MVLFIWINSLFWGLTPLMGWSRIGFEPTGTSCTVDFMHPDYEYVSYIVFCGIWCYALPLLVMVYCRMKNMPQYDLIPKNTYTHNKVCSFVVLSIQCFNKRS